MFRKKTKAISPKYTYCSNNFPKNALILKESDAKISAFIENKDDILDISNLDGKVTLVIYKTQQNKIFAY